MTTTTTTTLTTTTTTIENGATTTKTTTTNTSTTTDAQAKETFEYLISLRRKPRVVEVLPGLLFGNVLSHLDDDLLRANHVSTIVDIGGRINKWKRKPRLNMIPNDRILAIQYRTAIVWESEVNLLEHLTVICDFIDHWASPILKSLTMLPKTEKRRKHWIEKELAMTYCNDKNEKIDDANGPDDKVNSIGAVLVTCEFGRYCSPIIIMAYLMRKFQESAVRVMKFLHSMVSINIRPKLIPPGQVDVSLSMFRMRQIIVWERVKYEVWQGGNYAEPKRAYRQFLNDYGNYFTLAFEAREFYHNSKEAAKDMEEWEEKKKPEWRIKDREACKEKAKAETSIFAMFRWFQIRKIFHNIRTEQRALLSM